MAADTIVLAAPYLCQSVAARTARLLTAFLREPERPAGAGGLALQQAAASASASSSASAQDADPTQQMLPSFGGLGSIPESGAATGRVGVWDAASHARKPLVALACQAGPLRQNICESMAEMALTHDKDATGHNAVSVL